MGYLIDVINGLTGYISHFVQIDSWAKQTPESLSDIQSPRTEYGIYFTIKSAEISSVLSGLIAHPIYRYYLNSKLTPENTTPNSHKKIRNACRRMQGRCLIAALCLGPFLSIPWVKYVRKWDERDLKNRCYQIRKDWTQMSIVMVPYGNPELMTRYEMLKEPVYEDMTEATKNKDSITRFWTETYGELPAKERISIRFDDRP